MKHLKFILPLFLFLFSCSTDSNETVENTQLELIVLDENSVALNNVEVKLYATQEDYDNDTNVVATSTTNASGKVTFENLQPITYFWKTTVECYLENTIYSTVNPIENNSINLFSTNLTSNFTGQISITNNTAYSTNVTFTGPNNESVDIASGSTEDFYGMTSGSYFFETTPNEGPLQGGTIQQTIILDCGGDIFLEIN